MLSAWLDTYRRQPHGFKTCLLGRDFHTLIKNVSFLSPTTHMGSHNSLQPSSELSSPNPLLTDIIRFYSLRIAITLKVLKRVY